MLSVCLNYWMMMNLVWQIFSDNWTSLIKWDHLSLLLITSFFPPLQPAHEKIGVVDSQWIIHQVIPSLGSQVSHILWTNKEAALFVFVKVLMYQLSYWYMETYISDQFVTIFVNSTCQTIWRSLSHSLPLPLSSLSLSPMNLYQCITKYCFLVISIKNYKNEDKSSIANRFFQLVFI